MTVETFHPKQTTTLETPAKTLEAASADSVNTGNAATGNRIGFVSLGCPKNLVDSERILTQLR
ncbi:MAG: 30S ribosomal protein S12 methylthiotransferase RimO, partial [Shewanella sp.]